MNTPFCTCAIFPFLSIAIVSSYTSPIYLEFIRQTELVRHISKVDINRTSLRPHSLPFVSGDTFRAFAHHLFDETSFNLSTTAERIKMQAAALKVSQGETVFVKTDMLHMFFAFIHPSINANYILITHNADDCPDEFLHFLENNKIIKWFAQNIGRKHKKLHPLPIGFPNARYPHGNVNNVITILRKGCPPILSRHRPYLLYVNIRLTEKRRLYLRQHFRQFPKVRFMAGQSSHLRYLHNMCMSKFVLSPVGNGVDCHRTWEALAMGAIPIVQKSNISKLYEGSPVLMVDDLLKVTKDDLMSFTSVAFETKQLNGLWARTYLRQMDLVED